ncbi:NAD-dependent epimerase/dehydratase family protein [Levilactobacillus brevis]|uniref:NAD-dependent epimerase/dehydratase family protein n=1 Tax=Levilactobacillus brevis TaxID=1580 RepID=UPI0021A87FA6|nr:NAD-dependent epimerase/dehydratase family protein [Levilactobacillus brevis]MCT3574625.1 NAD-dependent epimerase/dehydratase family protein [Levilactobacillus brevis]
MKKVLITGKNSYIGQSFKSYVEANYPSEIQVDSISVRGEAWREYDFSGYDAVLHVAALVHKNEKSIPSNDYQAINTDLTIKVAEKAKSADVSQFIFISTIAVYKITEESKISTQTQLIPTTKYGKSKLDAENNLQKLNNDNFCITIIRPPMIYGPNCPGNYKRLSLVANKIGIYPRYSNQRSMIFIDNLSLFIYYILLKKIPGVFIPQNKEYIDSSKLISTIRKVHGKKTLFIPGMESLLYFLMRHNHFLNKIYGSLKVDSNMSSFEYKYNKVSFTESIKKTEI